MPSVRIAQLCGKIIEFVVSRAVGFTEFSVFPTAPVLWWVSLISEEWGPLGEEGAIPGIRPPFPVRYNSERRMSAEGDSVFRTFSCHEKLVGTGNRVYIRRLDEMLRVLRNRIDWRAFQTRTEERIFKGTTVQPDEVPA